MLIPYLGYSATKTFVFYLFMHPIWKQIQLPMFLLRCWKSIKYWHTNLDVNLFTKYFAIWKSNPLLLLILCLKIWRNPIFTWHSRPPRSSVSLFWRDYMYPLKTFELWSIVIDSFLFPGKDFPKCDLHCWSFQPVSCLNCIHKLYYSRLKR